MAEDAHALPLTHRSDKDDKVSVESSESLQAQGRASREAHHAGSYPLDRNSPRTPAHKDRHVLDEEADTGTDHGLYPPPQVDSPDFEVKPLAVPRGIMHHDPLRTSASAQSRNTQRLMTGDDVTPHLPVPVDPMPRGLSYAQPQPLQDVPLTPSGKRSSTSPERFYAGSQRASAAEVSRRRADQSRSTALLNPFETVLVSAFLLLAWVSWAVFLGGLAAAYDKGERLFDTLNSFTMADLLFDSRTDTFSFSWCLLWLQFFVLLALVAGTAAGLTTSRHQLLIVALLAIMFTWLGREINDVLKVKRAIDDSPMLSFMDSSINTWLAGVVMTCLSNGCLLLVFALANPKSGKEAPRFAEAATKHENVRDGP